MDVTGQGLGVWLTRRAVGDVLNNVRAARHIGRAQSGAAVGVPWWQLSLIGFFVCVLVVILCALAVRDGRTRCVPRRWVWWSCVSAGAIIAAMICCDERYAVLGGVAAGCVGAAYVISLRSRWCGVADPFCAACAVIASLSVHWLICGGVHVFGLSQSSTGWDVRMAVWGKGAAFAVVWLVSVQGMSLTLILVRMVVRRGGWASVRTPIAHIPVMVAASAGAVGLFPP